MGQENTYSYILYRHIYATSFMISTKSRHLAKYCWIWPKNIECPPPQITAQFKAQEELFQRLASKLCIGNSTPLRKLYKNVSCRYAHFQTTALQINATTNTVPTIINITPMTDNFFSLNPNTDTNVRGPHISAKMHSQTAPMLIIT